MDVALYPCVLNNTPDLDRIRLLVSSGFLLILQDTDRYLNLQALTLRPPSNASRRQKKDRLVTGPLLLIHPVLIFAVHHFVYPVLDVRVLLVGEHDLLISFDVDPLFFNRSRHLFFNLFIFFQDRLGCLVKGL